MSKEQLVSQTDRSASSRSASKIAQALIMALLVLWGIFALYPAFWVLSNSLKPHIQIVLNSWIPWPRSPADMDATTFGIISQNYAKIFSLGIPYARFLRNSVILVAFSVAGTVLLASLASFVFARFTFRGKGPLFLFMIAAMFAPTFISIVPLFTLMKNLRLLNNIFFLSLPHIATFLSFSIFVLTAYMRNLPDAIEDAAIVDGANLSQIFLRIVMPISKAGVVAILIYTMLWSWNSFTMPLILVQDINNMTLSVGIRFLSDYRNIDYGSILAGLSVFILVPIVFYAVMRERLIQGLTAGSVKG